jgi:hypothetical protein
MAMVGTQPLSLRHWERWEPLTGVVFALLFFVGQDLLTAGAPGEYSTTAKIRSFYADKSNSHELVAGKLLVVLSVIFFIWFVSLVATRLHAAEGGQAKFTRIAFGAGVAAAVFIGAAVVFGSGIASSVDFSAHFREGPVDPQLVRLLDQLGYSLLILGLLAGALMIGATAVVARRTALFPRWLTWSSVAVAILLVPAATAAPLGVGLLSLWSVAIAIVLLLELRGTSVRGDRPRTA